MGVKRIGKQCCGISQYGRPDERHHERRNHNHTEGHNGLCLSQTRRVVFEMSSPTPTERNRYRLQAPGTNLNTWGSKLNDDAIALIDESFGVETISMTGNTTLVAADYSTDQARNLGLWLVSASGLASTPTVFIPSVEKLYGVVNKTSYQVKFVASGTTATVNAGVNEWVACDGTNVEAFPEQDAASWASQASQSAAVSQSWAGAASNSAGAASNSAASAQTSASQSESWAGVSSQHASASESWAGVAESAAAQLYLQHTSLGSYSGTYIADFNTHNSWSFEPEGNVTISFTNLGSGTQRAVGKLTITGGGDHTVSWNPTPLYDEGSAFALSVGTDFDEIVAVQLNDSEYGLAMIGRAWA